MADQDIDNQFDIISAQEFSAPILNLMDTEIRQLRLILEDWKLLLVAIKDVLIWKKQWHPFGILGATTVLFTLLWLLEPSYLTLLSFGFLLVTICDYLGPAFFASLFRCNQWNVGKEKEFDEICTNLVIYKTNVDLFWTRWFQKRQTKPKLFYIEVIATLCCAIYICCKVDNLFMTYVLMNLFLLKPGLIHNGFTKNFNQIIHKIGDNLKATATREPTPVVKKEN